MNSFLRSLILRPTRSRKQIRHFVFSRQLPVLNLPLHHRCTFSTRYFSDPVSLTVQVDDIGERNLLSGNTLLNKLEKIDAISVNIMKLKPGDMKEVQVREACQALDTLANSMQKTELGPQLCDKRGEISWVLLKVMEAKAEMGWEHIMDV
jgi:hypothetical protein